MVAPRRKVRMRGSLERGCEEPHFKIDERAATWRRRVAGARPDEKPSFKKSKTRTTGMVEGSRRRRTHHLTKAFHVESYMRDVEGRRAAWRIGMTSGETRDSVRRTRSASRRSTERTEGLDEIDRPGVARSGCPESATEERPKETPSPQTKGGEANGVR